MGCFRFVRKNGSRLVRLKVDSLDKQFKGKKSKLVKRIWGLVGKLEGCNISGVEKNKLGICINIYVSF